MELLSSAIEAITPELKEAKKEATTGTEASTGQNGNQPAVATKNSQTNSLENYHPEDPKTLKKEIEEKERLVNDTIQDRFKKMEEEEEKLKRIKRELRKMTDGVGHDIHIIRAKIEDVQRNLGQQEMNLRAKERECREINENVNKLRDEKQKLTEHLRIIIYENEKKKQEKLRELMLALGLGDVTESEARNAWKGFNI